MVWNRSITGGDVVWPQIGQSVRFNSADSDELDITFGSAEPTADAWSVSFWLKRVTLGTAQTIFYAGDATDYEVLRLTSGDKLEYKLVTAGPGTDANYITAAVLKDPTDHYHIYADRNGETFRLYVNGVQITTFDTADAPSTLDSIFGSAVLHRIGADHTPANFLDGVVSDFHFVSGSAVGVTYFTTLDPTTSTYARHRAFSGV